MKRKQLDLQHVDSKEHVARIIFSPSYIYNGRVSPTAFRWEISPSGKAEDYISVLRDDGSDLKAESEGAWLAQKVMHAMVMPF